MTKSLHQKFRDLGYIVKYIIQDKLFDKGLSEVALDYAGGKYNSIKIIPSDIAVKGEINPEFIPEPKSHLVYVKYNPEHSDVKKLIEKYQCGQVANLASLQDGNGKYFLLNTNAQESILKLKSKKKEQ